MAFLFPTHPDDRAEIDRMRQQLIVIRKATDLSAREVCRRAKDDGVKVAEDFMTRLEHERRDSPLISSVQKWAGLLGCRVEFEIENFWLYPHGGQEMLTLHAMSRQWGADEYQRQWLVSALGQWRIKKRIDVDDLAELMGVRSEAVRDWEVEADDPVLKRAMLQARMTGTRVTLDVWRKEDWIFAP